MLFNAEPSSCKNCHVIYKQLINPAQFTGSFLIKHSVQIVVIWHLSVHSRWFYFAVYGRSVQWVLICPVTDWWKIKRWPFSVRIFILINSTSEIQVFSIKDDSQTTESLNWLTLQSYHWLLIIVLYWVHLIFAACILCQQNLADVLNPAGFVRRIESDHVNKKIITCIVYYHVVINKTVIKFIISPIWVTQWSLYQW